MKSDDSRRLSKYASSYVASTAGLKIAARLDGMKGTFAAIAPQLFTMEGQVKAVLGIQVTPIDTIAYPFYLAYARQLWALGFNGIGGSAKTKAAQDYKDLWTTRGLTEAVLIAIALDVFTLIVT